MARIRLITERSDAETDEQRAVYDAVTASRGSMIRPFEVLAHVPALAGPLSDVGAGIRFGGSIPDPDRELVILTAALHHGCDFEWDSHVGIARSVGVREEALTYLRTGEGDPTDHEALVIGFVRELCSTSTLSDETFGALASAFGDAGVVELTTTVGYYTLLAFVMRSTDAC